MKLEHFIIEHSGELFDVTPSANHAAIMAAKLHKRKRLRVVRLWSVIASVAAVVMAVALFSISPTTQIEEPVIDDAIAIELAELTQYYDLQRQEAVDTIKEMLSTRSLTVKNEIMAQVATIKLDSKADPLPDMLLTIDADKYLALTVERHQMENQNLQTLINILNQ